VIFNTGYLFNYDALNQKVFVKLPNDSTLRLGIDFNSPSGSNYISYLRGSPQEFTSGGITSEIVLGDTHNVYSVQHSGSDFYIYKFADNLGISYFHARSGTVQAGSQTTQNVISAIIDSLIYNPIVLSIDTMYPIQDRPVDTFPYLLTIPYTASYSALVDSFYLFVKHFRADTLVQTKFYNISKGNPKITLYLNGLIAGDNLKFRAAITDTSIYYNIDHYPDTGWVVMNILPPILNMEDSDKQYSYNLFQNYPNPFNPNTIVGYQLPVSGNVTLKVYNLLDKKLQRWLTSINLQGNMKLSSMQKR